MFQAFMKSDISIPVPVGASVVSAKGEAGTLVALQAAECPCKEGKVHVRDGQGRDWYNYASVWGLRVLSIPAPLEWLCTGDNAFLLGRLARAEWSGWPGQDVSPVWVTVRRMTNEASTRVADTAWENFHDGWKSAVVERFVD